MQQYFAGYSTTPILKVKIGGTLTSIQAVQRPASAKTCSAAVQTPRVGITLRADHELGVRHRHRDRHGRC
ncbi:hypothetical protein [Streptomyces himastatinicus]|uniref:hypothetical protein n=1 Tax=Streptomyces himastatinicus TaxID=998084 RepID=UPI0001B4E637|nr:hypothetical protein [Streptomyces himastatinicus]